MIGYHLSRFSATKEDWLGSSCPLGNISRRNQRWHSPSPPSCRDVCTESMREAHLEASQMQPNPRHGPVISFDTDGSLALPCRSTSCSGSNFIEGWNLALSSCTMKKKYLKKGVLQLLCLEWAIKPAVLPTLSRCQFNDIHFICQDRTAGRLHV